MATWIAAGGLALVPVLAPVGASAAVPANSHFSLGTGQLPNIAVGSDGTAYVAWLHQPSPDGEVNQVQFCRVPRGARKCVGLHTFTLDAQSTERPYVFLPGGSQVWIVTYRCCIIPTATALTDQTVLLRSGDGGRTFGAPVIVGAHSGQDDAQLGPDNTLYTINERDGVPVTVQRDALDGSGLTEDKAQLSTDRYGGSLAVLPGGSVLASYWDFDPGDRPTFRVARFSGNGDANASASWHTVFTAKATASRVTGGRDTELASGKKGVYLLSRDGETFSRLQVRRWTGSTFGPPSFITPSGATTLFATFWEDASGRTAVAYYDDQGNIHYRASDRQGFRTAVVLKASRPFNLRGATAADGGGFVAYDDAGPRGHVSLVAIPAHRLITESLHGSVLSGKVVGFRAGQPVLLQRAVEMGWVAVATKRLNTEGRYAFVLPHPGVTYRAVAPEAEGYGVAVGAAVKRG